LAVSCLLLPACGGGGGGGSPTAPQPTPTPAPTTTNIFSRQFSVDGAPTNDAVYGIQDVSVANSGQVQVTFDWTFSTSDIDLVVTPTTCTDALAAYNSQCTVNGSDKANPPGTRASVTFALSAAGSIRIWIFNFTPAAESGVLNVLLTR
jgi:hypothetical protein